MIIVAPSADRRKTGRAIHIDRRIAVADFEMDAASAFLARAVEEVVEQERPDAAALLARKNRD